MVLTICLGACRRQEGVGERPLGRSIVGRLPRDRVDVVYITAAALQLLCRVDQ
jgi:hypothetical protein